jgi:hypothetical protein
MIAQVWLWVGFNVLVLAIVVQSPALTTGMLLKA